MKLSIDVVEGRLLGTSEVARILGVSTKTVDAMRVRGELKALRIGSLWKFREHTVQDFLNRAGAT